MRNALWIYVLICYLSKSLTRNAVRKSFEFLRVPTAALLAAPRGINASLADRDLNFIQFNPALAGDTLAGITSVNYQFYIAGIGNCVRAFEFTFSRSGCDAGQAGYAFAGAGHL